MDAASFLACAAAVAAAVPATRAVAATEPYLRRLAAGLRFLARDDVLARVLAVSTVGNFLIAALAPVLLPIYAREELGGAGDLAFLVGAYGAGGLAGAAAYAAVAPRVARRTLFAAVWIAYPPLTAALVALPPVAVAAALLFLVGVSAGAHAPLEQSLRQERTPPELRGRVFASYMASLTLVVPPAMLAAGLAVEAVGLRGALAGRRGRERPPRGVRPRVRPAAALDGLREAGSERRFADA